jgi:hypothetical protein
VPFADYPPRLGYGDDRIVEVGKTISVSPQLLEPCSYGLHASTDIIHALRFGKGMLCCRVALSGRIIPADQDTKHCASRRRVLAMVDISQHAHEWVKWLTLEALKDWHECPNVIRDWAIDGRFQSAAHAAANRAWANEIDNAIETISDLVRHLTISADVTHQAARAASWLISDSQKWCRFINPDIARANLMERITPLFDAALLEDK